MWTEETIKQLNERFLNAKKTNPKYFDVALEKITSFEDLHKLPISQKEDTGLKWIDLTKISNSVISSSGATGGVPTYTTQSFFDYQFEAQILGEAISKSLPEGNVLVNMVPVYGPWRGGYLAFMTECFGLNYVGLSVVGRSVEEMVEYLSQFEKSNIKGFNGFILMGYPHTILKLGEWLEEKSVKLNIKGLLYVFAGLQKTEFIRMQNLFPNTPIHTYVGSTEANGIAFSETPNNVSILTPLYKSVYFWLVNPDNYEPITEINKTGVVIATCLYSDGKPFNVEMSDLAMWLDKVGGKYQLKGRKRDFIDLKRASPIRFPAVDLKEEILRVSNAENCQFIIPDFGKLIIVIEKSKIGRILNNEEISECFLKASNLSKNDILKEGLFFEMKFGDIQATSVGKIPLVIDRRDHAGT